MVGGIAGKLTIGVTKDMNNPGPLYTAARDSLFIYSLQRFSCNLFLSPLVF